MFIRNVHERKLSVPIKTAGTLIDGLASNGDALWPHDRWPPMKFNKPLQVGARGGHGPIRYFIKSYESGRNIEFQFTAPEGFDGIHKLELVDFDEADCVLRHAIEMNAKGLPLIKWLLVIRPLHDALLEDALDRAERFAGKEIAQRPFSARVKFLRWLVKRSKK